MFFGKEDFIFVWKCDRLLDPSDVVLLRLHRWGFVSLTVLLMCRSTLAKHLTWQDLFWRSGNQRRQLDKMWRMFQRADSSRLETLEKWRSESWGRQVSLGVTPGFSSTFDLRFGPWILNNVHLNASIMYFMESWLEDECQDLSSFWRHPCTCLMSLSWVFLTFSDHGGHI